MLFDTWYDLWRVAVIAVLAYAAVVVILRVSGKRSLSKLNIFDFVVTVAFGSILATILLSRDVSWAEGALAFAMLAILQWSVSFLSVRAGWFRRPVRAEPRLVFENGQFLDPALRCERLTRGEVESAIRKSGHGSIGDIAAVVLETDGELSVIAQSSSADGSAFRNVRGGEMEKLSD